MPIKKDIQTHLDAVDDSKYATGIILDFRKAFDTVDSDILIKKLEDIDFTGVGKIVSYLKGRKQFVAIENETSTTKEILTEVPQGSVLGPLLLLIYINDLHTYIEFSKTYHFADETNIMQSNKSLEVLAKQLNKSIESLVLA